MDVDTNILERIRHLHDQIRTLDKINSRVLTTVDNRVVLGTRLQMLFGFHHKDQRDCALYQLLLHHGLKAECLGPGSFDTCIQMALEIIRDFTMGKPIPDDSDVFNVLSMGSYTPTRQDLLWVLESFLDDQLAKAMLHEALILAGFAGRILVEKSSNDVASVELVRGYTFDQKPAFPVSIKFLNARVICIDGFIESVSELHHLLEEAAETKTELVLFVRGLADDVRHTLKVNYDRGTLKVIPVIVKFDLEGINSLNDISIATGADLISSNRGDLISSIRLTSSTLVDEVIIDFNRIVIFNRKTSNAVATHVQDLRRRRTNVINDVGQLYDQRIKSLSPNHVIIRLPDDRDFVIRSQAIDYTLRAIKALVDYGTIVIDDKKWLTASYIATAIHSRRCARTLASIGAQLTLVP